MGSYLDFLKYLVALGAKLPQLLPILLQVIELLQQAATILGFEAKFGAEPSDSLSGAEMTAEGKVLALCNEQPSEQFAGAGSIIDSLRNAWAFIQSSPVLQQVVKMLLEWWAKQKA